MLLTRFDEAELGLQLVTRSTRLYSVESTSFPLTELLNYYLEFLLFIVLRNGRRGFSAAIQTERARPA